MVQASDHVYVLLRTYTSQGFAGKKYNRYVNEYVWHV